MHVGLAPAGDGAGQLGGLIGVTILDVREWGWLRRCLSTAVATMRLAA